MRSLWVKIVITISALSSSVLELWVFLKVAHARNRQGRVCVRFSKKELPVFLENVPLRTRPKMYRQHINLYGDGRWENL
jgi:hypothetical protein